MLNLPPKLSPLRKLLLGYVGIILAGWGLLCLPFSSEGEATAVDHLFSATTSLTTTGLTTVDFSETYSWFGELVTLVLIQIGGIGYMSLAGLILLSSFYATGEDDNMVQQDYELPEDVGPRAFLLNIVRVTIVFEVIGALLLGIGFYGAGEPAYAWKAVYISVSAFCTAGLDIMPNALDNYRLNPLVNYTIMSLSLFGSTGFFFIADLRERFLNGKRERLNMTSRVILLYTCLAFPLCTLAYAAELDEPLTVVLFQAVSTVSTTGFSTVDIGSLGFGMVAIVVFFMFVGAAPSGTGGGIKNTAFMTVMATLWGELRQLPRPHLMGKSLPDKRIRSATHVLLLTLITLIVALTVLLYLEPSEPVDVLFEAFSAMGTVGLSRGITADFELAGRLLLIFLMFAGRVGVFSLLSALVTNVSSSEDTQDDEVAVEE